MRIQKLELKGFKRLSLSLIDYLKLEPENQAQVILGTNGSGKSSLLSELTPSLMVSNDYFQGGFKVLEVEHEGHLYRLVSEIEKRPSHWFYKDGALLNENGTGQIQKSLIEQELGVNEQLFALLGGQFSFSSLTPNKRRELITSMSNQDFDYAFGVYKTIQSQLRDQQGAIRHVRKRIEQEQNRLAQRDDSALQGQVDQLKSELQHLLQSFQKPQSSTDAIQSQLHKAIEQIQSLSQAILEDPVPSLKDTSIESSQRLQELTNETYAEIESLRKLINHYMEEYERLEKLKNQFSKEASNKTPQAHRKELTQELEQYQKQSFHFEIDYDPRQLVGEFQKLKSELCEILTQLPDNSDGSLDTQTKEQLEKDFQSQSEQIQKQNAEILRLDTRLKQIEQESQVKCPQCEHEFKPGVGANEKEQLEKTKHQAQQHIKQLTDQTEKLKERIRYIEWYQNQIEKLRSLARSYPLAKPLFEYLFQDKRIRSQPSQLTSAVERFCEEITTKARIFELSEKIQAFDRALEQNQMAQGQNQSLDEQLKGLDEKVSGLNSQLRDQRERYQKLAEIAQVCQRREQNYQKLQDWLRHYNELLANYIETLRAESIQKVIDQDQSELAQKEQRLQHYQSLEAIIKDLEKNEQELQGTLKVYQVLADALSPSDGIIADQIFELISMITQQVNEIIAEIYAYPLQVLPCKLDADELDFRFPVIITDEDVVTPDIAKASSGQREVIDFAFKIVALVYLGAQNYPLYFDELGRFQDEYHHAQLLEYLRKLIDHQQFPQLFLISHYAAGHGSFHNADVHVLNAANVTVPQRYNERLELA